MARFRVSNKSKPKQIQPHCVEKLVYVDVIKETPINHFIEIIKEVPQIIEKEIIKYIEIPVTKEIEKLVEIEKEIIKYVDREVLVIKEIPVEITKIEQQIIEKFVHVTPKWVFGVIASETVFIAMLLIHKLMS